MPTDIAQREGRARGLVVHAFGNALGDAVVGKIVQVENERAKAKLDAQIDKYLDGVVDGPSDASKVPPSVSAKEKAQILAGFMDGPGSTTEKPESSAQRSSSTEKAQGPNGDPNNIMDPKHPGTYMVEKVMGEWTVTRATQSVETDKAAINGMLNELGYAAWLMGKHAEAEFGKNLDKFTLYYNPTEGLVGDAW